MNNFEQRNWYSWIGFSEIKYEDIKKGILYSFKDKVKYFKLENIL